MYLKRITIAGFKSFAGKAVLELEPGITAVVGPNGSGKSNLADAIRWALGEQSKGRLRLGDREEVVFAGTDRRPRASYAEVTLLFNNEDGSIPLELTEVEISRRLYRSGETDYRLGGRSVRLGDIQQLLAEAGFGANTYAVIGQGMIDNFLLSSPAERKLLFDEAAGIRSSELKREAALRKLAATAGNLTRLRDIHAELEPRLDSLRQAMAAAEAQAALEQRVVELRQAVVAAGLSTAAGQTAALEAERADLTLLTHRLRHERRALERDQAARLRAAERLEHERAARRAELSSLEADYDRGLAAQAERRAALGQLEQARDHRAALARQEAALAAEAAAAQERLQEIIDELAANQAAADRAARAVDRGAAEVARAQAKLVDIRSQAADGTQQQYVAHALAILKTIAQDLAEDRLPVSQLRLLVHKAGRLLSHASKTGEAELLRRVREAQTHLEAAMTRRETATEHQTNITITCRSLEIDLAHQQATVQRLEAELVRLRPELAVLAEREAELTSLRRAATTADHALAGLKQRLAAGRQALEPAADEPAAASLAEAAARLERLQYQLATASDRLLAIRAELQGVAAAAQRYRGLARDWALDPATIAAPTAPATSPEATDPAALERELDRLHTELATRQSLQHATSAEFDEVNTRYTDLTTQITDLEQAQGHLQQLVAQLDGLIRDRFRANFATLAERFSHYFTRLFDGGSASLELEEQDGGEYGILIKASPKGKRLTNLSALSGGERAMAGVALLAAILSVNPSPFVVLDEIDAALDEANSGRLAGILEELAAQSQLIVITHNRQTMRAARVLFGVTMNEHHVSHVLSLRLEEATQLAAR